jgi:hypothetical protein
VFVGVGGVLEFAGDGGIARSALFGGVSAAGFRVENVKDAAGVWTWSFAMHGCTNLIVYAWGAARG